MSQPVDLAGGRHRTPTPEEFSAMQASPEFAELRRRFRRFVFPMTVGFLVWYFLYVLLAVYATGFMGKAAIGNVTWGLIIGLAQFATTFLITAAYIRFANREIDPVAARIREELEGTQQTGASR